MDAEDIFEMVTHDREFKHIIPDINHDDVLAMVNEALHVLHRNEDAQAELYTDTCMVISVLLQWLVRYLCKRLMQLMTPEALILHSEEIPTPYIQNYLRFQEHFALKDLVKRQFEHLKRNNW